MSHSPLRFATLTRLRTRRRRSQRRRSGPAGAQFLIAAILAAILAAGCGDSDGEETQTTESDPGGQDVALISNGDFETGLAGWTKQEADGVEISADRSASFSGRTSVKLVADDAGVEETVALSQATNLLPESKAGSEYRLTMQVKTENLSRAIQVNLKLVYGDGDFEFFSGGEGDVRTGIPEGTTDDWLEVAVPAFAKSPLESIEVFAINSGPGKLDGTVWIDDVRLETINAA
jgi:hypothetical protein